MGEISQGKIPFLPWPAYPFSCPTLYPGTHSLLPKLPSAQRCSQLLLPGPPFSGKVTLTNYPSIAHRLIRPSTHFPIPHPGRLCRSCFYGYQGPEFALGLLKESPSSAVPKTALPLDSNPEWLVGSHPSYRSPCLRISRCLHIGPSR